MTIFFRRFAFGRCGLFVAIAILGVLVCILIPAFQIVHRKEPRDQASVSLNPFGNTQLLSANARIVTGPRDIKNIKVEGIVSILTGQTLSAVKVELGTITNGAFRAVVPAVEVTLNPVLTDNYGTYSHHFLKPTLATNTSYSVRVRALQRGPIRGQQPVYATVTVP